MKKNFLIAILFLGLLFKARLSADVRPMAVAGQFYPGSKSELQQMLTDFFQRAVLNQPVNLDSRVVGLMVPHAGYVYSGQCAAYAYKFLSGQKFDYIFLIGNSHHYYFSPAAIYDGDYWETPLGEVKVARAVVKQIVQNLSSLVTINNSVHLPEHSLEVQIPFLQQTRKDFQIVCLLLSSGISRTDIDKIALGLKKVIQEISATKNVLLIASSDMSHYPARLVAEMVDAETLKAIENPEPEEIFRTDEKIMKRNLPNLVCTLCGRESVYLVKKLLTDLGRREVLVLHYDNSATSSGDSSRVVGYGAVAFFAEEKMKTFTLSQENQKSLLNLARQAIRQYLKSGKIIQWQTTDAELTRPGAAFVTLTEKGNLRGCIGMTVAMKPLYQTVIEMAIAAATEDSRFRPVTADELKDIAIEISVLSPLEKVNSAQEIIPHKHGVVVRRGGRSGLFLPQVWEHFQRKEDFLNELCWEKAGLAPDAWKDKDTELYIFTVFAFSDEKLSPSTK